MKKIGILLLLVIINYISGCDSKWPENGKLDGMWQLMEIVWEEASEPHPERMYYSVQLKLINMRQIGGDDVLGYFRYTGDSLHVCMRQTSKEIVRNFGLSDTIQSFGIEKLTKSRMVLTTFDRRLSFRKF